MDSSEQPPSWAVELIVASERVTKGIAALAASIAANDDRLKEMEQFSTTSLDDEIVALRTEMDARLRETQQLNAALAQTIKAQAETLQVLRDCR